MIKDINNPRKNPYVVWTIVLGLIALSIVIGNIIEGRAINKTENEILCSVISATPAWASEGKIIQYGIMIPQNMSIDLINEVLIPERIKMLYNPDCPACEKQIDYFKSIGNSWENYVNEGLAIDCNKIK